MLLRMKNEHKRKAPLCTGEAFYISVYSFFTELMLG